MKNLAAKTYLWLLVATDYPDQEPASQAARNRDLALLLIPIVGVLLFILTIQRRWHGTHS